MNTHELPHDGVLVRLGASPIHGVGVFARQSIDGGTKVFANDTRPIVWIPATSVADLPLDSFQRALYADFAIRRGDQLGCPANFDLLTVGWYVNEPVPGESPNLFSTPEFDLIAARNIACGEELTISYRSFSRGAGQAASSL